MSTSTKVLANKLSPQEADLATGIGTALAAEVAPLDAGIVHAMQLLYVPIRKALIGRQHNMARHIVKSCKAALIAAKRPVGTVAQIATVALWCIEQDLALPKLYGHARKAYETRKKAERAPRQPSAAPVAQASASEAASVGASATAAPAPSVSKERAALLASIAQDCAKLSDDALLMVALFATEQLAEQVAELEDADHQAELAGIR